MTLKRFFQVAAPFTNVEPYATDKLCQYDTVNSTFSIYDKLNLTRSYDHVTDVIGSIYDDVFSYTDQNYLLHVVSQGQDIGSMPFNANSNVAFWPNWIMSVDDSDNHAITIYRVSTELSLLVQLTDTPNYVEFVVQTATSLVIYCVNGHGNYDHHVIICNLVTKEQQQLTILGGVKEFSHDGTLGILANFYHGLHSVINSHTFAKLCSVPEGHQRFTINKEILVIKNNIVSLYQLDGTRKTSITLPDYNSTYTFVSRRYNDCSGYTSNNKYILVSDIYNHYFLIDSIDLSFVALVLDKRYYVGFVSHDLVIMKDTTVPAEQGQDLILHYAPFRLDMLQYYIDQDSMCVRQQLSNYLLVSGEVLPPEMLEQIASNMFS